MKILLSEGDYITIMANNSKVTNIYHIVNRGGEVVCFREFVGLGDAEKTRRELKVKKITERVRDESRSKNKM